MSLKSELGLRKGFDYPAHEALLGIYYTAAQIRKKAGDFFRGHELTDVQFNVLSLLKHQCGESGGLTQVELSRMMLVNRANITTLIDRMEKAGLVQRLPIPNDRRYNTVKLTRHGDALHTKIAGVYQEKIARIMEVLNQKEMKQLTQLLEKVRTNLDGVPSE